MYTVQCLTTLHLQYVPSAPWEPGFLTVYFEDKSTLQWPVISTLVYTLHEDCKEANPVIFFRLA